MSAADDEQDRGKGFLGRWIKRKAEARERDESDASPVAETQERPAQQEEPEGPVFDIASLPGLDEINADTKLADFLRKEVPAALRNAALKRAWAIDPAIRDYVNPAREYAYDWNTPGGVPGFGPLEAGFDALKQVAASFTPSGQDHTLAEGNITPQDSAVEAASPADVTSSVRMSNLKNSDESLEKIKQSPDASGPLAEPGAAPADLVARRRRHGGAAPA